MYVVCHLNKSALDIFGGRGTPYRFHEALWPNGGLLFQLSFFCTFVSASKNGIFFPTKAVGLVWVGLMAFYIGEIPWWICGTSI